MLSSLFVVFIHTKGGIKKLKPRSMSLYQTSKLLLLLFEWALLTVWSGGAMGMPWGTAVKVEDVVDNNFTEIDQIIAQSTSVLAKNFAWTRENLFVFNLSA